MRFFPLILIASFSLFQSLSVAESSVDLANGNRIQEPALRDYVAANRAPELAEITDIVDQNGQSVTSQ